MALLKLKDIGKIYVSEGNVAVGIRGVNLAFEKGEFVAVTGKSGSGKSTLLNVISGMDSYEEGELFIDEQPTSHYVESDWEAYREQYVSFIFQDYNIIESFTVLENVELALFHIEDKKERRARAIELLTRVGLGDRLSQKGSKLSGGQKQRTVIARALAKDSPIILADEPTGNLDSKTAKEIIELLCEVAKDKLLIVVTHNFEQVKDYATRHVRIYDGAVEFDHSIQNSAVQPQPETQTEKEETDGIETPKQARKKLRRKTVKNGFALGLTVFKAKPKLSTFLCLLLIVGGIGIFLITSLCGDAITKEKEYLFRHVEGRVVLTRDAGEPLTTEEMETLANTYGAKSYLRYDGLLDDSYYTRIWVKGTQKAVEVDCVYGEKFGDDIVGRYPEAPNEVFLYLPIYEQPTFGKKSILKKEVMFGNMDLKVVGLAYYYDNNQTAKMLFSNDGFHTATSVLYLDKYFNYALVDALGEFTSYTGYDEITGEPIAVPGTAQKSYSAQKLIPAYDMPAGQAYFAEPVYSEWKKSYDASYADIKWTLNLSLLTRYEKFDGSYGSGEIEIKKENVLTDIAPKPIDKNPFLEKDYGSYASKLYAGLDIINELADEALAVCYRQASLFFDTDDAAIAVAKKLSENGYIAVASCTQANGDPMQALLSAVERFMLLTVWLVSVLFLGLFIYLCTARAVGAFKGELGIMRSMGISASVVRVSMYARMLFALIPAFTFITAAAFIVFLTPTLNGHFVYLYATHYAFIFGGMFLLTAYITRRQIRKLFKVKVKKSLKGGAEE